MYKYRMENFWQPVSFEESQKLYASTGTDRPPIARHIPGICKRRTCYLFCKEICIGTLSEEMNGAGEQDWVFEIDWPAWEKSGAPDLMGIDYDLRWDKYVRQDFPSFIECRTLGDNYEDLENELARMGMNENDRFEFMLRTHGISGIDDVYVGRTPTSSLPPDKLKFWPEETMSPLDCPDAILDSTEEPQVIPPVNKAVPPIPKLGDFSAKGNAVTSQFVTNNSNTPPHN